MGKHMEGLQRLLLIIRKLKGGQSVSKEELLRYVNDSMQLRDAKPVDFRTLHRDFKEIAGLFGIDIHHVKERGGYCMEETGDGWLAHYEQLFLNFEVLNALDSDNRLESYVLAEHHRPLHSEWLYPLIRAIKFRHPVSFLYRLVRHEGKLEAKRVRPHYLKESNQRWYLLAYDADNILKTFGVDRIEELRVLDGETFRREQTTDVRELFKDCYGIWNQADIPVEDIELRYDALDGAFLKTVPLHHSQTILVDTSDEFRISLRLRITNDFVMELLSRSRSLEVIKPVHLRERIRHVYEEALKRNA